MNERITPEMISSSTLADVNSALTRMERSSQELSSGRSILEPSDNPYGASRAIELQGTLDGLSSYASSVADATSWEQTASSAMSSISEVTERVRELVVQAGNGTNNETDLEYIADEVDQLTEAVKQDANTKYAGQYIFSGTLTGTAPYETGENDEYQGNTGAVLRAIGPGASVSVSSDLASVLGNGSTAEDGKLLDVLRTISKDLRGGTTEDLNELRTTDLANLERNIEGLTTLQADAGSVTDQLEMASSRIEDLQTTTTSALSNVEDANFATVSVAYSSQQAAYEAALKVGSTVLEMPTLVSFLQ